MQNMQLIVKNLIELPLLFSEFTVQLPILLPDPLTVMRRSLYGCFL